MIRFLLVISLVFFAVGSHAVAQDLPDCTIPISEIEGASTHLRNIQERVDNLNELFTEAQAGEKEGEEFAYELMYWTVFAENSVELNKEMVYPECSEYATLTNTFSNLITDMYAVATQTAMLMENRFNDYQNEQVRGLLKSRLDTVLINLALWDATYKAAKDI